MAVLKRYSAGAWAPVGMGGIVQATTAPASPVAGDLWLDTDEVVAQSGTSVRSASVALTGHVPNGTVMEQWGTEEAVIAQADAPSAAVVLAWLTGSAGSNAAAAGDRGEYRLEVSFDGGASFATIGDTGIITTAWLAAAGTRGSITASGRATGTVTGDIQVRAMCRDIDGANDMTFQDGIIIVMVHAQ